jgi:Uma2 family endonuclease
MSALPVPKISVEEYLALDRAADVPSEYHDGEMFPVQAVSLQHSIIGVKTGRCLDRQLEKTACHVAGSGLRVRVSPTKFVTPDLLIFCGKPALTDEHHDTLTNPKVIVEILSDTTADYDFGHKFMLYRKLASFEEYVLIAQDRPRVETFRKTAQNRWVLTTYEGLDAVAPLETLGISLPLAELYEGVELPEIVDE